MKKSALFLVLMLSMTAAWADNMNVFLGDLTSKDQSSVAPMSRNDFNHDRSSGFTFEVDPNTYQGHVLETKLDESFITAAKKHLDVAQTADALTQVYRANILGAWRKENYKTLEALLYQYREAMRPTRSEARVIQPNFYNLIIEAGLTLEQENSNLAFSKRIKNWQRTYPDSISPQIVLAKYLINKAYEARGFEYAGLTPVENLNRFHSLSIEAYVVLNSAQKKHKKLDPEFYATEVTVLLCASAPNAIINHSFHAGLALDPDYLPLYDSMSMVVMPRWGGDLDDLASLAYFAAAKHSKYHNADGQYVRVVEHVLWGITETPEEFLSYGFSWPIIKSGYIHDTRTTGLSTVQLDMFRWLAVLYNDKPAAKVLFDTLGDTRYRVIWGQTEDLYRKAQNWANGTVPVNPLRPDLEKIQVQSASN